jgi:N-methylhydantoinase B
VLRDVRWGKVSVDGARDDYGAVVVASEVGEFTVDSAASDALRASLRGARTPDAPFFDRGPGYPVLSGGRTHADVDFV